MQRHLIFYLEERALRTKSCEVFESNKYQKQLPKGLRPETLLKKRLWHRCFPVNSTKFLGTAFLKENLRWLLLKYLHKVMKNNQRLFFSKTKNIKFH